MADFFGFLLPAQIELEKMGFTIPTFKWEGVLYPKGTLERSFGLNFKLQVSDSEDNINYISRLLKALPVKYKNIEWQVIEILGDGLDNYAASFSGLSKEEDKFTMKDMINFFLKNQKAWAVLYEPEYDGFLEVIEGKPDDILLNIKKSLNGEIESFLIYSIDQSLECQSNEDYSIIKLIYEMIKKMI